MTDWFQAFKEECQKHDATKATLAEACELLGRVAMAVDQPEIDTWLKENDVHRSSGV